MLKILKAKPKTENGFELNLKWHYVGIRISSFTLK